MADQEEKRIIVICKFMGFYWRSIFLLIWPFIASLVFLINFEPKIRCLFVVVLMAGYWVTETLPLYVTGLLPVVLLPVLAVVNTADVCVNYMNSTNMIFMASLFIASAIEYCGLHKRIAYGTILLVGCSPRKLHFGLTVVIALLSMWLINSATTAMMCPIIHTVLGELESQGIGRVFHPKEPTDDEDDPPKPTNITIAYFLTAAYASTIGGIGSIVGTDTNLTYKGIYETRFPHGNQIEFVPWLLFNVPPMLLLSVFCWFSLELMYMGLFRRNSEESKIISAANANQEVATRVIREKMNEMGRIQWSEGGVLALFIICICMWFFRRPQFIPGWLDAYDITKIDDATPAIGIVIMFAALPAIWNFVEFCRPKKSERPKKISPALVPWKILQDRMPWGLLFLLGGGFALADAGKRSGMSKYLGEKLTIMSNLPSFLVLCITSFAATMATELTANVAICNIVVPVLIEMSLAMKLHPIQFTFPATVLCSFAFMLPVGTPPNAIVVEQANIRTIDMIKGGFVLKMAAWLIYLFLFPSYGRLFYDQGEAPSWALNSTAF